MSDRPKFNHDDHATKQANPLALTIPEIPDGFIILQDTREQLPLFSPQRLTSGELYMWKDKVPICGAVLSEATNSAGDYSIHGYRDQVCVELKRWGDFMSYAGKERQLKTIPKLERMSKMKYAEIVVIEDYANLIYPQMYGFGTQLTTNQVRGFLKSLIKYRVGFYCNASEDMCRMWVLDRLVYMYKLIKASEVV